MNSSSRKPHRKSRTGCGRCKKRKIKCDELKPECTNCVKHSVQCDFLLQQNSGSPAGVSTYNGYNINNSPHAFEETPSSSHSLQLTQNGGHAPVLNLLHLELLHNFSTSTCNTLHSDLALKTLWRINVPQLGFQYDFVMRGVLALSALHLAHFKSEKRDFFISQAKLQNQAGLLAVAAMLPNITNENCSAIYIFSALTCIFTVASPREPGDFLNLGDSGVASWLTLFRGTRSIIDSSPDALQNGVLGPMFIAGARRTALREEAHVKADGSMEDSKLTDLRQAIKETVRDSHALETYMGAIDELEKAFTVAYKGIFQTIETTDVFIFLFRVSEEYLTFLKERTQESLAIFAYFCVIAKRLENNWWSVGWSNHLMSRIYSGLDEEHKLWIRWPIEEIGWVPTQEY